MVEMSVMNNRITPSSFTRRSIGQDIKLLLTAVFCLSVAVLTAAEKKKAEWDANKLPPAASKTGLAFEKDIKPIIEKSCAKCHGGEKPKSKYRVDTRQNLIKGGESGDAAIIPGASGKSPLVAYVSDLVEDMEMPPTEKRDKYPQLTKEQIGLIRAWIDQGAK